MSTHEKALIDEMERQYPLASEMDWYRERVGFMRGCEAALKMTKTLPVPQQIEVILRMDRRLPEETLRAICHLTEVALSVNPTT